MNKIDLHPDQIPDFLINQVKSSETVFIFSTDTVMNSWIEFLITHPETTGTDVLPLERFMAWDNFKRNYLRAEETGLTTIPSILRKLFILDLISKNAKKNKNERFQVIINPEDEYAASASSFASWICSNLPSLHFWQKRLKENAQSYGELDAEDLDYQNLYSAYKDFLTANSLYEPSWVENLELGDKSTKFIIFYPELLEDYNDFETVFSKCNNITITVLPENIPAPKAYFYPDSRSELRQTMLQIIQLVNDGKADWSEIALSVPDIDTYRPYLEREFDLYEIPYVIKSGLPLTKNSAGQIFREISNCHTENYSFDTVRALILDETVPWKNEHAEKREALVRLGNEMRCICSPGEKDIWLSAFQSKINHLKNEPEKQKYYEDLKNFYSKLKHFVEDFYKAETFNDVNKAWLAFKHYFLEADNHFSETANNILGRCISELAEIISIEEKYADCGITITNPFDFFLSEIDSKKYTPQQKNKTGVNIFPYKLSGPAFYKYQFVIDSSQKNLDIPYKRLTFLNATKREKLHLIEDDKKLQASEVFIKLYNKNCSQDTGDRVVFSAAENTFSGFAIPHNCLEVIKEPDNKGKLKPVHPDLNTQDYILTEHNHILKPDEYPKIIAITEGMKNSFEQWKLRMENPDNSDYHISDSTRNNLHKVLWEYRNGKDITGKEINNDKIKITARADLEKFFPCPRKWLLSSVLKLRDDSLDTELFQNYDIGNLNHKILELFIGDFTGKHLPYYDESEACFKIIPENTSEINTEAVNYQINLSTYIEKAIFLQNYSDCPLVTDSLKAQKQKIEETMFTFLKTLLLPCEQKSGSRKGSECIAGIGKSTVIGCEITICEPADNFNYFGKIDCLLKDTQNNWIIVDYKNSSIPGVKDYTADSNNILNDFQMPLYFKLIKEENIHEITAGLFYSIKNCKKNAPVDIYSQTKEKDENGAALKNGGYFPDKTYEFYKPNVDIMSEYAELFYQKVSPVNGKPDFTPYTSSSDKDRLNVKSYENCIQCVFKSICRTTYNVGKKTIAKKELSNEQ